LAFLKDRVVQRELTELMDRRSVAWKMVVVWGRCSVGPGRRHGVGVMRPVR
jgi:hypothetical protein